MLRTTIFVLCLASVCLGAQYIYPAEEIPAEYAGQGDCWISSESLLLKKGVPAYPHIGSACDVYNCRDNGVTYKYDCDPIAIQPGCTRQAGDLSLQYPKCCDREAC